MCHKCLNGILIAIILVFTIWDITVFDSWIIVVAAAIILIKEVIYLISEGCEGSCIFGKKSGPELFMEKSKELNSKPSKEEIKETLKKK